ncbi:hypothetical protein CVV43_03120 [Candidatus Saccharibacteria bacterium HGW-Saccharibacteria-1]|jgi:uncharacterized SAM-binding protein YcdF (DUF218 family)|nr:MAG: hypothetical protein CVV43_03120 [Candidatus Saccharibacteria bacterium HGW-Saccharibacteria-1]
MIKHFVIFGFILAAVTITGISFFLQADDMGNCGKNPSSELNCQKVDAIVAVSGGDTTARTNEAIAMYENGWSDILIFSGAAEDKTGPSNALVMKRAALAAGVPASSIMTDEDSETTSQNAKNSKNIFTANDIKSVILVTSGYHQRRASLEFEKQAGTVKILNHPLRTDKDWSFMWWMSPTGWFLAVSEIIKVGIFYASGAV